MIYNRNHRESITSRLVYTDKYWSPSGAANWGDSVWALSEGGTGDQTPPGTGDNAFFTSTNNNNCAVAATANCANLSFNSGTGKYTGTFSGSGALNVYGSLLMSSTMNRTYTGSITFLPPTGTTVTVTCDTIALASTFSINAGAATGVVQLVDAFSVGTAKNFTLTNGGLDTNDQTVTCAGFVIASGADSIDFGNSIINCASFFANNNSTITPTVGNSSIRITGTGDFGGNSKTYYDVQLNGTANTISQSATYTTLTRTGTAAKTDTLTITAGSVQTIGTLKILGNSAVNRPLVLSSTLGTHYHLAVTTMDTASGNFDIQDCVADTAIDMSGFALTTGDCGGNTSVTCSAPQNCYWVHGATTETYWSGDTGGNCWFQNDYTTGTRVPLPQDSAIFDTNAFAANGKTVRQDMPRIGSVDFADTDQTFTFKYTANFTSYGDMILDSNLTWSGSGVILFAGRRTNSVNCAGKTFPGNIFIQCPTGTVKLTGDWFMGATSELSVTMGTLSAIDGASNYVISTGRLTCDAGGTWDLGSATHLLNGTGAFLTYMLGTVNAGTYTLKITDTSNTALTFGAGTSKAYNNIWFARGTSTATNTITATTAVTFADIKDTGTANHTNVMPNVTTTCTSLTWDDHGTGVISWTRTGGSGAWALNDTTGTNAVNYCNISNCNAGGGAVYDATGAGNVNGGGNTGWLFSSGAPVMLGFNY